MKVAKPFEVSKKLAGQAYLEVKSKGGAAGVDGESLELFEHKPVRLFLTILSPAILIIPTLFVMAPAIYGIVVPGRPGSTALESGKADVPIVMVIFDELPLRSLLDRSGNIDSDRFPNFADLANDA